MALVLKDRVRETTTTQGTGTVTLAGAVAGFQSFSAIGNANTTYYTINLPGVNEWEVGIGTYTASGTTLSRDTVLSSSNSGNLVNFSAGVKDVFCTYPAGRSVYYDTATNVTLNTLAATTIDTTNLEVTNVKAKDGTAAITLADSTGAVTVSTALTANGGAVFNENGADVDFRIEGDTDANLIFADASTDRVGIGTNAPASKIHAFTTTDTIAIQVESSSTNAYPLFSIKNSGASGREYVITTGGSATGLPGALLIRDATAEANRLTITSGGQVNIGGNFTSTNNTLQVTGNAAIGYTTAAPTTGLIVAGNVGIGTQSPTTAYGYTRVIDIAGQFPGVKFTPSGANTFGFQIGAGTNGFQFYDVAASAERMRITSTGTLNIVGAGVAGSTQAVSFNGSAPVDSLVLASSGVISTGKDMSIYGITVGRGAGAVSTNTAVGASALAGTNTGGGNVGVGISALAANTGGDNNTAVGNSALATNTNAQYNTAIGSATLLANTTGANNTAIGRAALISNTTASNNVAVGFQAANNNTTGTNLVAIGTQAGYSNTTANNNISIGYQAQQVTTTGANNIAVGTIALALNTTGASNIAIGTQALYSNTTASNNTAVGYQAGYSQTTADGNALFGYQAGTSLTTGNLNSFFGAAAGGAITTGAKNTILGRYNGNQGGLDIRTADNYIVLSDGDGNPRAHWDGSGNTFLKGSYVSFGNNGYIRIDQTNSMAIQAGSSSTVGWQVRNNGNSSAMLSMSGTSQNTLALEGASPQAGTGITFPATQSASSNANTLDDYEEGTWTPTVGTNGTMSNVAYTTRIGNYIKIGTLVYLFMDVEWTSTASTGTGSITGLPFTSQGSSYNSFVFRAYGGIDLAAVGGTTHLPAGYVGPGSSDYQLQVINQADGQETAIGWKSTGGRVNGWLIYRSTT
jgi:hypothetical protein